MPLGFCFWHCPHVWNTSSAASCRAGDASGSWDELIGPWKSTNFLVHFEVSLIPLGLPPTQDAIVTTRIMNHFLVGNHPCTPLFATVTGRGPYPTYTLSSWKSWSWDFTNVTGKPTKSLTALVPGTYTYGLPCHEHFRGPTSLPGFLFPWIPLSHEKNPGWLGYIGDYTTQLYRDYNKPL